MPRKNKNARKTYVIGFKRFARSIGLTPLQRVKIIKYVQQAQREGGVTRK